MLYQNSNDLKGPPDNPNPSTAPGSPPAGDPPQPSQPPSTPGTSPGSPGSPQQQNAAVNSLINLGQPNAGANMQGDIHCITIIGQIEGHMVLPPQNKTTKYEHILPQLVAVEQNPSIKGLLVLLNTVGGDVEAGLAIAEMIETMSTPSVSIVLGGGHSIGVPIAVSSHHSFIAETATMTIHPLRLSGLVIGVPQTYEYLDKMQDRITKFVVRHSNIDEEKFKELMFRTGELARDIGTVLVGNEAVDLGIINKVGGLGDALAYLRNVIDNNCDPESIDNLDKQD